MYRITTSLAFFLACFPGLLLASDAGVSAILSPASSCGFSPAEPIRVAITNYGPDPIASVDLVYFIDGVAGGVETFTAGLAAGATSEYTFATPADLSGGALWSISARTLLPADTNPGNDSLSVLVASAPATALPLADQFEFYAPTATVFTSGLVNLT